MRSTFAKPHNINRSEHEPHLLIPLVATTKGDIIAVMTGEAQASTNEYMKEKYYFVLSDVSEFNEILNQIEPSALRSALEKIAAPADLFK